MLEMNEMLKIVVERGGSDLHLHVGKPSVMRLHGILDIIDPDVLTPGDTERLMREITPPRYQQHLQEHGSADFAYSYSNMARFRCAVYRGRGNISVVMRLIPAKILTWEELGLPKRLDNTAPECPQRAGAGYGTDRKRKDHNTRHNDRLHQ